MAQVSPVYPPLVWTSIEFDRDWRTTRFVERFLDEAAKLSLVGEIESLTTGTEDLAVASPGSVSGLPAMFWKQGSDAKVVAQGRQPREWSLSISVLTPAPGASNGRMTLRFAGDYQSEQTSDALWAAFRRLTADDTDCAYIDRWERWLDLRDEAPPLVSQAAFETVLWANFVNADLMRRFHREQLVLEGADAEWTAEGALYLRLSKILLTPDDQTRADMEQRRKVLRESFFRARTY